MFDEIQRNFQIAETADDSGAWTPAGLLAGEGDLPSWFGVTDLAAASIAMAGIELSRLAQSAGLDLGPMRVDRRLASFWFGTSLRPTGWALPPKWDSVAGDYRTDDGWIRLHTNAPHHRAACLSVLDCADDREAVAASVAGWKAAELETAVVGAGGCAAEMRGLDDWLSHPQGSAVAAEPLVIWDERGAPDKSATGKSATAPGGNAARPLAGTAARPLGGIKVLDLTRVLAGPAATRFLAAFGAEVLRIDPPRWSERANVPEMTLGKRCAGLDLEQDEDRRIFAALLSGADVLVHGYRPGALDGLGFGADARRAINPGLIDVALCAYGWSGPWAGRRGFDSLIQMSSGIADFGMKQSSAEKPVPLPVQALDHTTGYLMAAAVLHALRCRQQSGRVLSARLSLARTAHLLIPSKRDTKGAALAAETPDDLAPEIEETAWGPARRIRFPLSFDACQPSWNHPAGELRGTAAAWMPG